MYTFNGTTLTVNDTSYDPGGESLTSKTWVVKSGSGTIYSGSVPMTNFAGQAAGEYTVTLTVENESGIVSEAFSRTFTIVQDTEDPTVSATAESGGIAIAGTVTLTFSDAGGSDLNYQKYALMSTETAPGDDDWSASSNNGTRNVVFYESGTWYLYFEVADNAGNTLSGHFGPYTVTDTEAPTDPAVSMKKTSDDSEYVSDTWIYSTDSVVLTFSGSTDNSGFVYYQYSTDGGTTWTDSSTVTISDGGTTTVQYRARDKSNNYSNTAQVIVKKDATAPTFTASIGLQTGNETTVVTASISSAADGETSLADENPYSITLSSADPSWTLLTENTFTTTPNTQVSVTYRVKDIAGNIGTETKSIYTAATTPDAGSLTANTDGTVTLQVEEYDNPDNTYYYVQKSTSPDFSGAAMAADWTNPGADSLITISGLDRGTTYYFRIMARNNDSVPVETDYGSVTGSILTIPADVSAPTVTASSASQLNISWSAVTGAVSYDVYYSENGTDYTLLKNVAGTSVSDVSLAPNTGRQYYIVAKNSSGDSESASAASIMRYTYAAVPGLAIATQPDGSVNVSISTNGNTAGTEYFIEYATDSEFTSPSNAGWSTAASKNITGLTEGTGYYFHVKARNGNGTETAYSGASGTTTTIAAPVISSVVASVSGTTFKNTITWGAVDGATSYRVYRDGTYIATASSGTTYEDDGLKANKAYAYTVSSVSAGGESSQSASESCRTLAAYPTAVTVTDKTENTLTLKLTPSSNLGNNEYYRIILKNGDTDVKTLSWSSDLTYVVVGLDNATEYSVWVDAANSDSEARGAVDMLTVYCNRDVSASVADNADALRSEAAGYSGEFAIALKVWDPDGDEVTVTATVDGLVRSATLTAPATEPADANATLRWDVYSLSEGAYTDIVVSVSDGLRFQHDCHLYGHPHGRQDAAGHHGNRRRNGLCRGGRHVYGQRRHRGR